MLSKKEQKFIKSLKVKKYRLREKRFLVEGAKNVHELLSSDFEIDFFIGTNEFYEVQFDLFSNARFEIAKPDLLAQLGNFKTNEKVLAVVKMKVDTEFEYQKKNHLFVLDGVGDPGNLGTIIRTLDWFGFKELVCSDNCAEFYHPKVISSTMGSFSRVSVHYRDLKAFLSSTGVPIIGADMSGKNLFDSTVDEPSIIVMGSESHGLSEPVKKLITKYVAIPKLGGAESLNVGVATGIIAGYLRMAK